MRLLKNLINRIYWEFIGEITVSGTFNGKTIMLSLKRGELHRLYVGPKGLVEHLTVQPGYISQEEFNFTKSIYEQQ